MHRRGPVYRFREKRLFSEPDLLPIVQQMQIPDTAPERANAVASPRLEVVGVSKAFPGVRALRDVSLRIDAGEVLALIGENGAGKSTLMKILAGIEQPDAGVLKIEGQPRVFDSPSDAIRSGIALIHQELNLHEGLTVAENLFLGREPHRGGWIRRQALRDQAAAALARVGFEISPQTPLGNLSVAARQLVEIARALASGARIVIMDEPTSSLTTTEAERLFELVEGLKQEGVSVVYISHRLGEVIRLADRVEVLRDGCHAGSLSGDAISHDAMVSAMVGRQTNRLFDRRPTGIGKVRLAVDSLRLSHQTAAAISFEVRAGEMVGITGLVGSGRSELVEAIFGLRDVVSGTVSVDGDKLARDDVRASMASGLALVSEDRKQTGLLVESSVLENITLAALADSPQAPWLDRSWQRRSSRTLIDRLRVKTPSEHATVASLSGGNQQKVALAKWLLREPRVLMLDEPTRGVDIGAKQEIYELLQQLTEQGLAILFVSSEMEEVLALADRVLVMHEGGLCRTLSRAEMSEEAIMRCAVGVRNNERSAAEA